MYLCVVCVYVCVLRVCIFNTNSLAHKIFKSCSQTFLLPLKSSYFFLENNDAYITFYIEKCDNFIMYVCNTVKSLNLVQKMVDKSVVLVSCPMWSSSNNVGFEM